MNKKLNLLAGDIGGTKILLAIYEWDIVPIQKYRKKYFSSDWSSLEEVISHFVQNIPPEITKPSHGCLAVAGRLEGESVKITNLPWKLDLEEICKTSEVDDIEIINDFEVLVYGLDFLNQDQIIEIQSNKKQRLSKGVFTIVGAGTGLGIARGLRTNEGVIALPSEGGHVEFAPRNQEEWELSKWIKEDLNIDRLSVERIVSGTGLGNIAKWILTKKANVSHPLHEVATIWNSEKSHINSQSDLPSLASHAAKKGDPLMKKALRIWLSAYGSAVGDIALHELCYSGLWLSGGTTPKQIDGLRSKTFLEALRNKGRFTEFLKGIPVTALIDQELGLFSAACKAHKMAYQSGRMG
ncbi:glucokinase [Prochlorococcus sp. MIT 1341]|uniref:glucokinase n=1 Tax=Prochlorococcus sp. MIT 1341 TaxID=3096221 RepID=UPI002A74B36C|nr:glucokinase [Prochlorococcus sp. MIT 1341]